MDLDFDSAILSCFADNDDGGSSQRTEAASQAAQQSLADPEQSPSQSSKDGLTRLPSFPTTIGGTLFSVKQGVQQTNQHPTTDENAQAAAAATAAYIAGAYHNLQPLVPLTMNNINASNQSQAHAFPRQSMMVQYALTGQATGAPFPSVSFNTSSQDTVSVLSSGESLATGRGARDASVRAAVADKGISSSHVGQQSTYQGVTQLHPLRMQANDGYYCPLVQASSTAAPSVDQGTTALHPFGIQSSAGCPPLTLVPAANPLQFNPYMLNPYMFANNQELIASFQASQKQMSAPFVAAHASVAQAQVKEPAPAAAPVSMVSPPERAAATASASSMLDTNPPSFHRPAKKPKRMSSKASPKKKASSESAPPFLLFDAPTELRTNFMNTQRMLNLPVHHDTNSYHYGMAVNGFHPQMGTTADFAASSLPETADVQLLDARHKMRGGAGKERNEREQKRAQKIAELIEQIRFSMEEGGWRCEMKSKYHTLSTCSDYVQHLMKTTKEKEEAVEKARSDLEIKERKLEEDKAVLEGRSDPESVTSSLTVSTSKSMPEGGARDIAEGNGNTSCKKRKSSGPEQALTKDIGVKKVGTTASTEVYSGGNDGGNGPRGHNISIGKMSSSVSDITDSNKGSSDSGGEKPDGAAHKKRARETGDDTDGAAHKKRPREAGDEDSAIPSTSSISSTALVVLGTGSHIREHGHADVVFKERSHSRSRKRSRRERSSLDRRFDLAYEDVFVTSNVPQFLATPAGRIVAWNKFVLKATGLTKAELPRLTIFSIVKPDKLANLFEMVAIALRQCSSPGSEPSSSSSGHTTSESSGASSQLTEYATMTLPCTTFPASRRRPLYMTVTLMPDDDERKRCFHCLLTDRPGTDGQLGFISPELLAKLFEDSERPEEGGSDQELPVPL